MDDQFAKDGERPTAPRILILDDEPSISELLGEMLNLLGYSATKCNSARNALRLIEAENFDVILSDFHMPEMNGGQFYSAATAAHPELARRIVFLTGDAVNEEMQRFLEKTGNRYLGKPFNLACVEQIIAEIMGREAQLLALS